MVVLDTDHMTLLEWGRSGEQRRLLTRLADLEPDEVTTTIISFEEQTRGWLAYLARTRTMNQQVEAYRRLNRQLDNYRRILVLDFDDSAAAEFQQLQRSRIRVGTMDLKIAAIVLARDATLLSRNRLDFSKVPGVQVEDWTV